MPPGFVDLRKPGEIRAYIAKIGERLMYAIAKERGIQIGRDRAGEVATIRRLAEILAKYTAGLGIIEILLNDPNVEDVFVDAPAGRTAVYVTIAAREAGHQRCVTNISLTEEDREALLARFRFESGRPFSEAMPVLETNLEAFRARVTVVGRPLSPEGLAMALRRHSPDPWTLPRMIRAGSLTPLAAGLLSFLIDGRSTILIAGSRGAGKSSLLGALLFEFSRNQRILTIEDTLELPGPQLQDLGYKVQSLYIESALGGKGEMSAEEALRVCLRLGESAIVLGEVRGQEARTLYEAMRAGTAGSAVLGTIHGNTSTTVYDPADGVLGHRHRRDRRARPTGWDRAERSPGHGGYGAREIARAGTFRSLARIPPGDRRPRAHRGVPSVLGARPLDRPRMGSHVRRGPGEHRGSHRDPSQDRGRGDPASTGRSSQCSLGGRDELTVRVPRRGRSARDRARRGMDGLVLEGDVSGGRRLVPSGVRVCDPSVAGEPGEGT